MCRLVLLVSPKMKGLRYNVLLFRIETCWAEDGYKKTVWDYDMLSEEGVGTVAILNAVGKWLSLAVCSSMYIFEAGGFSLLPQQIRLKL